MEGTVVGSPAYLPPELIQGLAATPRADVYAFGCVAYFALTHHMPFEEPTVMATLLAHVQKTPEPPSALSEQDIPEPLERLIMACLAKSPDERPQSFTAIAADLRQMGLAEDWTEVRSQRWWRSHLGGAELVSSAWATQRTARFEKRGRAGLCGNHWTVA